MLMRGISITDVSLLTAARVMMNRDELFVLARSF